MNEKFFETIKCNDFEIFNLEYHKKRISKTIGLNLNLEEYIYPPTRNLIKCKITYDKINILSIDYIPYTKKQINSFMLVSNDDINYDKKSTNRQDIETLCLKKEPFDEIIIVKENLITDTSIANIAIFYNNKWITPKSPLLFGTTRDRYLKEGKIEEEDITVQMLLNAKKIALLNAMIDFDTIKNHKIHFIEE